MIGDRPDDSEILQCLKSRTRCRRIRPSLPLRGRESRAYVRCHPSLGSVARPASFLGAPAGEMRLAQIELPLDPAPRLVFELAAAKQLVDVVSLGRDQLDLDFVVNLGEPSVALVTIAAVLDVLEPLAVTGTKRAHEPLRQAAFRPELFEPLHRC